MTATLGKPGKLCRTLGFIASIPGMVLAAVAAPPTIELNPASYEVGGYSTISWKGVGPCKASAVPAYAAWTGEKAGDWSQSVGPQVSTVFTIDCANGSASVSLTVNEAAATPASGTATRATRSELPVPSVLRMPIAMRVVPFSAADPSIAPVIKFAETARRNWNFEGHAVTEPFSTGQGYWDYNACATHFAAWLFDRPTAWFRIHELTGDASYRDQAIADFRYWVSHIDRTGYFSCKAGEQDTKYLYIEPFLLYEAATGDKSYRPIADRIYAASAAGFPTTYSRADALWTEREVAIHLDAALAYWKLTGNQQALARASAFVKTWTEVSGTTGAPLVSYTQHEGGGPGGTQPQHPTNSPWMSALYFQAARRYWQVTGDALVLRQASAYFDWLDANGFYDGALVGPQFAGVTIVRYLTGELIGEAGYDIGNMLHCPDVQGLVQFAITAKSQLGLSTRRAQSRLQELQACSQRMWAHWTRGTNNLPKYRIQAPRAWNWWVRGIYENSLRWLRRDDAPPRRAQ